jgi:hypothetical protein
VAEEPLGDGIPLIPAARGQGAVSAGATRAPARWEVRVRPEWLATHVSPSAANTGSHITSWVMGQRNSSGGSAASGGGPTGAAAAAAAHEWEGPPLPRPPRPPLAPRPGARSAGVILAAG